MLAKHVSLAFCSLLVLVAVVSLPASPAVAAAAPGEVLHEGGFAVRDLEWIATETGAVRPEMPDTRYLADPGAPDLPMRQVLLLVPLDAKVKNIEIEPLAVHTEAVPGTLAMAGPKYTDSGDAILADPAKAATATAEGSWGEFAGTHVWKGYRLLAVKVAPLRVAVDGDVRMLEFLDEFAVRVEMESGADVSDVVHRQRQVPGENGRAKDALLHLVANPERVTGYVHTDGVAVADPIEGFQPTAAPSLLGSAVSYLIITSAELESEFQRLADFKTAMGLSTKVVTLEFIQAWSRHGADLQDTIRMFIRDAYELWGLEFVLLGGDSDVIPARYVDNSYYPTLGSTLIPVDLYYATLDGNWNDNGNSVFGEPYGTAAGDDLVDFAEEVYLGRATVSDLYGASVFVDKVLTYESTAAGEQWTNRALFAAEVLFPEEYPEDDYITMDGAEFATDIVDDFLIPCTDMEYTRMYETDQNYPSDAVLTRESLIDTLNTGHYGIFNQIGHGFYFNMSVGNANFMTMDADNLVNGDHLFLMYTLNCASAAFDYSCLMERLVQNPNGGSVASIGAARAAFPSTSNDYQREFFDHLFCQEEERLGALIALSRLPFIGYTFDNRADRWTFENYTLLGDPSVRIWTSSPRAALVTAPASLAMGPNSAVVAVSDLNGPVEGALVCLRKDGEDYASGRTDALGMITLDFLAVSPGNAELTVSGENLALTTQTIPVIPGAAYVALSEMAIQDDGADGSVGNGNGLIEAGEIIALWPTFLETGGAGATGLTGTISTSGSGVTILEGSVDLGSVGAGGQTAAATPLLVEFDADLGDGAAVPFLLTVTDDGDGSFESEWSTAVLAPEIEFTGLEWDDSTYGNGNGLADSGERIAVSARLKNFGGGIADNITVSLRSRDSNVVIYSDSTAVVTDLETVEEALLYKQFSFSLVSMFGSQNLYLVADLDDGRTVRKNFRLSTPEAPLNLRVDSSLGPDVISVRWYTSESADRYGYEVYRSESEFGTYVRVNSDVVVNTAFYVDYGLEQFTKYYYKVATVDTSLMSSEFSEVVSQSTAPPEIEGFPQTFAAETSGPLAVGDVDGEPGLEIVLGSDEIYVWHHDGTELLDGDGNSQSYGPMTGMSTEFQPAAIVLANLDDVPGNEIIACELNTYLIHVFRKDGTELPGWPQSTLGLAGAGWNWASPAVGDIDGDGEPEVVVNTLNAVTWAWNADGTEVRDGDSNAGTHGVFLQRSGGSWEWTMSGPALADLDGDGAKDIIFGTKYDDSGLNRIMALKYDGTDVAGFPYTTVGDIPCHPAVGDLDGDGTLEIVVYDISRRVYAVRQDGSDYPGFPYSTGLVTKQDWVTSPALGDMDGDGMLEIVCTLNESGDVSRLVVVDTDYAGGTSGTMLTGWPKILPGSSEGSPILGDINGDGSPDILQGIGGGSEDAPNNLYAFNIDGSEIGGFPITLGGPLMPSVTICDIEYDGDTDIVYGGWDRQIHVWDMPFAFDRAKTPWPTFHANNKRDGLFFPPEMIGVGDGDLPPSTFQVGAPFPNPFNPVTKVRLYVPEVGGGSAMLDLSVYDLKGRRVKTLRSGAIESGWYTFTWDGTDDSGRGQSSGLYFMRARSGHTESVHKMTLVK